MFFIRLLSRLPLSALYFLSDFLFFVSFYIVRYRRKIVMKNLRASFPKKSAEELRQIARKFYSNLCDYGVETLKLLTISGDELSRRMTFPDPTIPARFRDNGQSIIFLAAHQFNWEWLLVSASVNFKMQVDFIYQPVKNKFFDRLSLESRKRFGAFPIRRDEVARELVRRKSILRCIASVADQYPGYGRDKKFFANFLNQETAFFYGTNQLATLTQYPMFYLEIRKVRRGYYEGIPYEVGMPPYDRSSDAPMENYIRLVEKTIARYPEGWLWSHNRWKKRHVTS